MPHTHSATELMELGMAYYSARKFDRAQQTFTAAFHASGSGDLRFLDMIVPCHTRQGDLDSALYVGRKMIKLDGKDARGYLRLGQVLKLKGHAEKALEVYKKGLERCPVEDAEMIRMLQGQRDKLVHELREPKSLDPIHTLPSEVMDMVMEHLSFKQKVNCLRVSKGWMNFLSHQTSLWTELDLSLAHRPVHAAFVRNCIYRAKHKDRSEYLIHTAKINRLKDAAMVMKLVQSCRKLNTLEFLGSELSGASIREPVMACRELRCLKVGKHAVITLDNVTQILRYKQTLVNAEFENVEGRRAGDWVVKLPNLQKLTLGAGSVQGAGVGILNTGQLIPRMPNLKSLSLIGWKFNHGTYTDFDFSGLVHLENLHLPNTITGGQPRLPPSLRRLTLSTDRSFGMLNSIQRMREAHLPLLEEFEYIDPGAAFSPMEDSKMFLHALLEEDEHGHCLGSDKSGLRKFVLDRCAPTLNSLLMEIPRLHRVEELTLVQPEWRDEEAFVGILVDHFTHLRRLSIPSSKITGVGVKMLVKGLVGRLKYLNIDWNTAISPDAVEWARAQGVEVSWKTMATRPSGKKIRYG